MAGGVSHIMVHFTEGLQRFRDGACPKIGMNPLSAEEVEFAKNANLQLREFSDVVELEDLVVVSCTCCGEEMDMVGHGDGNKQALVNSEERIADIKKWREMMDTGINIDYRCVKCRNCSDCRNADETEKVSLRQDVEDAKICESVQIDYDKKQILATLPLRGPEEEFLANNRNRAMCVLNQQCKKFQGKEEDRKLVLKAFKKLFDRGYMVLLKDIPADLRKMFEEKPL